MTTFSTMALPIWEKSSSPWPIEKILEPQSDSKFDLTRRDLNILEALLEHRFFTAMQIQRLFFKTKSGYKTCSRRLKTLFEVGLVLRYRPMVYKGEGSAPYIFSLSQLGYEVLNKTRFIHEDISGVFYRADANIVETSRINHELELNEFCLDLFEEASIRKLNFEWIPTRLTRQRFSSGGKTILVEPDAVFHIYTPKGERVLHIEFERSADRRRFRQKIDRWKEYRNKQIWRERYGSEPFILVVGYERSMETGGRKRRVLNSILPLRDIAKFRQFDKIAFLTLEEHRKRTWQCLTTHETTQTIWELLGV
jgi:predicted transcriptional regulator